jgi:ribosomal protein S18 acetylase RimI-like enzyme
MKIRAASKTDVTAIANLHAESWRLAYRDALSDEYLAGDIISDRKNLWTERLNTNNQNQYVAIAEKNTQLLGFACAFAKSDPVWGTMLDNLHVSKCYHRNGVGSSLMQQVARWHLKHYKSAPVFLWVLQSNTIAQRFYEALGAENVGADIWVPPGGGAVPRFRYAWLNVEKLLQ